MVVFFFGFSTSSVKALTEAQIGSVLNLLESFGVDRTTVTDVENALRGKVRVPKKEYTVFNKDLGLGAVDAEVKKLQEWLNQNGYKVSDSGLGSLGNETEYFGEKTRQAVISLQIARKISPASGYFGPKTRSVISPGSEKTKDITYSKTITQYVGVDKKVYASDDKISIVLTAKNKTDKDVVLHFNSGCQFDYRISVYDPADRVEKYRYLGDVGCTMVLTEVSIPAGKTHSWRVYHDLSVNPLEEGLYKIEIGLVASSVEPKGISVGAKAFAKVQIVKNSEESKDSMKDLVSCLKDAGVAIYGSPFCPHCEDLVGDFNGNTVIAPIYVDCSKDASRCYNEMHTNAVPEIQIKGKIYIGSRDPEAIGFAVGCTR